MMKYLLYASLTALVLTSALASAKGQSLTLASEQTIVLGDETPVVMKIHGLDLSGVRLVSNVGSVSKVDSVGEGEGRVVFTRPSERFPQVAIVAALDAQGNMLTWLSFPLYGRPKVRLQSEPNARITVMVDGKEFGPVQTDRKGAASLEVLVPPGTSVGQTTVSDVMGNTTTQELMLSTKVFSRVLALCPGQAGRFVVLAVSPAGEPSIQTTADVQSNIGNLSALVSGAPGVYESQLVFRAGVPTEDTQAVFSVFGSDAGMETSCEAFIQGKKVEVVVVAKPVKVPVPAPRFRAAVHSGYWNNMDGVSSLSLSAETGYAHPLSVGRVSVSLSAGYYSGSDSISTLSDRVFFRMRALPLRVTAGYEFALGDFRLRAGAGSGITVVSHRLRSALSGEVQDTSLSLVMGGNFDLGYQWGRTMISVRLGYWPTNLEQEVVVGKVGGLEMLAGLGLHFW